MELRISGLTEGLEVPLMVLLNDNWGYERQFWHRVLLRDAPLKQMLTRFVESNESKQLN
jgi:hypothetical protein